MVAFFRISNKVLDDKNMTSHNCVRDNHKQSSAIAIESTAAGIRLLTLYRTFRAMDLNSNPGICWACSQGSWFSACALLASPTTVCNLFYLFSKSPIQRGRADYSSLKLHQRSIVGRQDSTVHIQARELVRCTFHRRKQLLLNLLATETQTFPC